jgi:hypothetical protein
MCDDIYDNLEAYMEGIEDSSHSSEFSDSHIINSDVDFFYESFYDMGDSQLMLGVIFSIPDINEEYHNCFFSLEGIRNLKYLIDDILKNLEQGNKKIDRS